MELWDGFMEVRTHVLKALEEARNNKLIGKSFEAKVTIYPNEPTAMLLDALNTNLAQVLIVSDLVVEKSTTDVPETAMKFNDVSILVEPAQGETCQRCRAIKEDVGSHQELPTLCNRCAEIVEVNYPEAVAEGLE